MTGITVPGAVTVRLAALRGCPRQRSGAQVAQCREPLPGLIASSLKNLDIGHRCLLRAVTGYITVTRKCAANARNAPEMTIGHKIVVHPDPLRRLHPGDIEGNVTY